MIFEPPEPARPRGAPSKTHTFQWFLRAPARPRSPPRRRKGHPPGHMGAYAFWSMSDHAHSPYLPATCMSRTPYKPTSYNRYGDRKRARPPCKPLYLPAARVADREDGRRTTKTAPEAPSPRTPHFCNTSRAGRARVRGGWNMVLDRTLAPLALFTSSWPNEAARTRIKPTTDARRALGGGGLPLPAAAAAAP